MGFLDKLLGNKRRATAATGSAPPADALTPAASEDGVLRLLTPEETNDLRLRHLNGPIRAVIADVLKRDPSLQSVTMLVAQYWNDEADDAVHAEFVFSELENPVIDRSSPSDAGSDDEDSEADDANLSGREQWKIRQDAGVWKDFWKVWDDNCVCIPLYAGFCMEGGHQEGERFEFYAEVATYRRASSGLPEMEFVGRLIRPWLDGVEPQSGAGVLTKKTFEDFASK